MNENFALNQELRAVKQNTEAASSDAPFARNLTLDQKPESGEKLMAPQGRRGPLQRNRTHKDQEAAVVISGLSEADDTIPAEVRSLDRGGLIDEEPSVQPPDTPKGPSGIQGYTSDINQNIIRVKDTVDICANSETHPNRSVRRSGDSLASPNGNQRESLQVPNGEQIFRRSEAGSNSVSASRTTFPGVNLAERGNVVVRQVTSQSNRGGRQAQGSSEGVDQIAARPPQIGLNIEKLNEHLNKILYGLLQQIELVKFLLQSESNDNNQAFWTVNSPEQVSQLLNGLPWQDAGQRVINTIIKNCDGTSTAPQNRAQIHSIESQSVKDIFLMLNNFAVMYLQTKDSGNANVILQCATQIYKSFREINTSSTLASMLYSNLSLYHLSLGSSASGQDDERASKYMDGAIIAHRRAEEELAQATQTERVAGPRKTNIEISLAISYNNKAVIELKRKNFESSKLFSLKTVEMIEPKVYGMVQAGMVSKVNQNGQVTQHDQNQKNFQELLQVLLISYFNLAMSQDRELSSRSLYLKGMQLCVQYMPGGRDNYLYQKFEKKYTRKMYSVLEQRRDAPAQVPDLDPYQDLPDILPLSGEAAIQPSDANASQISPNFQENLNLVHRRGQAQQSKPQPQRDLEQRSFTILDSDRQSAMGGKPAIMFMSGSVTSMPVKDSHQLQTSNRKSSQDYTMSNEPNRRPKGGAKKKFPQASLQAQALHSETIQPPKKLTDKREHRGVGAIVNRSGGSSSPTRNKRPPNTKKFEPKEGVSLRIGQQMTQPNNPSLKIAQQDTSQNNQKFVTTAPRQAQLPQIKEACGASAEESRQDGRQSIGQNTTPKNRFSKITYAEDQKDFAQVAELGSLNLNTDGRQRSNTFGGIQQDQDQRPSLPGQDSTAKSQMLQTSQDNTPVFINAMNKDPTTSQDNTQSPPPKVGVDSEEKKRQDAEKKLMDALIEQKRQMEIENEAKLKAMKEELLRKEQEIEKLKAPQNKQAQKVMKFGDQNVSRREEAKDPQDFSAAVSISRHNQQVQKKTAAAMQIIAEAPNPSSGSKSSPDFPKKELNIEMIESSPADKSKGESQEEAKKESTVMSFGEGVKSNAQPGLENYSQFARPSDDVGHQQKEGPENGDLAADKNGQGYQAAHVTGLQSKVDKSKTMELFITKDTTKFQAQKSLPSQVKAGSQGSSPEGGHSAVNKPSLNYVVDRRSQNNQPSEQALVSRGEARTGNQQFFQSLDKFMKDFNEADEEQFLKNLAELRSKCFDEESIQWKFLINVREHYRLFRPQNIWRFQLRLLEQIKKRQTMTCSKIIPQLEVTDNSITVKRYFKVTVEVSLQSEQGEREVPLGDILREGLGSELQSLLEDRILLTLSAEPETLGGEAVQLQVPQESLSFLLLQTLLYKFTHLEAIDPCTALSCESPPGNPTANGHHLMGSIPFYHIESFEDLCQHVVYPFVEISSPDQEWTSRRRSMDSRAQSPRGQALASAQDADQLSIEFCDIPQGLFVEPLMIAFLHSQDQATGANGDNDPASNANSVNDAPARAPLSQNCQTQGGGSPSAPQTAGNRQVASDKVNCQIDVHHIHASCFKVTIKPIFHTQTFLLKKLLSKMDPSQMSPEDAKHLNEIQQNNDLLLNLQPANTYNLIIDLELLDAGTGQNKLAPPEIFEKVPFTRFASQPGQVQETQLTSYATIMDTKGFYEKRLKKFIQALEGELKKEYREFFEQQGSQEKMLNQDLLSLIVGAKIVYCTLGIRSKGTTGQGRAQKPNYDEMYVVLRGAGGSSQEDLKIICLFTESGTENPVQVTTQNFETKVSHISEAFGQSIELSQNLEDQYILSNLCKIFLKTISWEYQKPEDDSDSEEASLNGDDSDDGLSASESDDGGSSEGIATNWRPCIVCKDIEHVCTQRRIIMKDGNNLFPPKDPEPIAVTFTLIAIREGKKMLGVRAVALNSELMHESGVFFLMDQMKWKETMKKFQDVQNSVKNQMLEFGFDYLFNYCLKLVPHKAGGYQLVLKDERMPTLEDQPDLKQKNCTITQLERYLSPERIKVLI